MPLVPQQDIVVIRGPYVLATGQTIPEAAAEKLKQALDSYPPCKIVSISGEGPMHLYFLTAVVETV